jgi:hypothetical protein
MDRKKADTKRSFKIQEHNPNLRGGAGGEMDEDGGARGRGRGNSKGAV